MEEDAAGLATEVRSETAESEDEFVDLPTVGGIGECAENVDTALVAHGAVCEVEEGELSLDGAQRVTDFGARGVGELVAANAESFDGAAGGVDFEEARELAESETTPFKGICAGCNTVNDGSGE